MATDNSKELSMDEAIAQAKNESKKIFLYFGAEWCPPCKMMKANIFPADKVKEALENYVVLFVDADENRPLAIKYQVAGIPAFMIVDENGKVLKRHSGLLSENQMSDWLSN